MDLPTPDNPITLKLSREDGAYVPGEPVSGTVSWDFSRFEGKPVETILLRLFWRTEGKGSQDVGVSAEQMFSDVSPRGGRDFEFAGLSDPYSFSGNLVSIVWAVEAIAEPMHQVARVDLTLSPTGQEVRPG